MIILAILQLSATSFTCTPARWHDGDNIYCVGRPLYRLENIDAPEWARSPRCRKPRPRVICNDALARKSTARLREIMLSGRVTCVLWTARQTYGRGLVRCRVNGKDVGELMIASRDATRWDE